MNPILRRWLQISLFNLLLVASLGVIMRYKIAFSLPFINQRNLLHAHSHFAFAGWITQVLMSLLVSYLDMRGDRGAYKKYRWLLYANLFTAYGMLLTFPFVGYALPSIIFSTLSIFVSYFFAVKYWKDLNRLRGNNIAHSCFKAAVLFNALSSLGAFSLATMLATKNIHADSYLASVYFFLHFQYNGWFFFSCMGLLIHQLIKSGIPYRKLKEVYILFVTACVPAYFLSALWLPIPRWIYALVVIAVFLQLTGWALLLIQVKKYLPILKKDMATLPKSLFVICVAALTFKLLLQAGSVIPSLSQLAFGFRPIVIGYLHLVLLGVITLFILSYIIVLKLVPLNTITITGLIIFITGIFVNEILLMIQGFADLDYRPVAFIDRLLFIAALILFAGIFIVNYGQKFSKYDPAHKMPINN